MKNYTWNFDLDTRPIHTLMSLSGLRGSSAKIRYFSEDGSYTDIRSGIDSMKAEREWIHKLREHYSRQPDSLFFVMKLSGNDTVQCKTLDQMLLEEGSFTELKGQLYSIFGKCDFPLIPLFFIEYIESTGNVSAHILLALPLPSGYDEDLIYKGIYPLCEAGGFYKHEYGLYSRDIHTAISDTASGIHDGLLIHETEIPWFQKKFEYIGNLQSAASLLIMIMSVLFINELVKLPFGWLLFAVLIAAGIYLFIRSRRNTQRNNA